MSYETFVESVAARLGKVANDLSPAATFVLQSLDLNWSVLCTSILYTSVGTSAQRFEREPEDIYDDIVAAADRNSPDLSQQLLSSNPELAFRLGLLRVAMAWRYHHLVSAPSAWDEISSRRAPLEEDSSLPKVSVIILSHNRLQYLRNTLFAFHRTVSYRNCELIVLDNGSTDGSAEFLRTALERGLLSKLILRSTNCGNARGFNLGCVCADRNSAMYLKLDSDVCALTPGWISQLVELSSTDPQIGIVAPNQVNHFVLRASPSVSVDGQAAVSWSSWACGSCMAIPRRAFDELGYFSEPSSMKYSWDDFDYWMRATRLGYRGYYLRDTSVFHQKCLDTTTYRSAAEVSRVVEKLRQYGKEYDTGRRSLSNFPEEYSELKGSWTDRLIVLD